MNQTDQGRYAVAAVIPARYASSRFPGKPLAKIAGKPMIEWVYRRAEAARAVTNVIVATDDERILETVSAFGGRAVMTSADHPSGTDRVAEAVRDTDAQLVLNVQGDEPLMSSHVIDGLVQAMQDSPESEMGTVAVPFPERGEAFRNPNNVKVVLDNSSHALYFSRSPLPYCRADGADVGPLWHWGLYAYRRDFLEAFIKWPPGRLEQCEKLEQLRALENGARIRVVLAHELHSDVNVPADIPAVENLLRQRGEIE